MVERTQETFLGLDIGTSSVKALLVDVAQRTVGEASVPLNVSRPHPLWSEQDPSDWVAGVAAAVAAIRRDAPSGLAGLSGIGLSGQMHGATLLDAEDKPLRPAILWNDGRSFAECAELKRRVPDLEARTGNLAMPGFTAPKMLWVAGNEPEIAKMTKRVLLPKDYVRLRLSGEAVSEMSDASGTLWLDVARRCGKEAEPLQVKWGKHIDHKEVARIKGDIGRRNVDERSRCGDVCGCLKGVAAGEGCRAHSNPDGVGVDAGIGVKRYAGQGAAQTYGDLLLPLQTVTVIQTYVIRRIVLVQD